LILNDNDSDSDISKLHQYLKKSQTQKFVCLLNYFSFKNKKMNPTLGTFKKQGCFYKGCHIIENINILLIRGPTSTRITLK